MSRETTIQAVRAYLVGAVTHVSGVALVRGQVIVANADGVRPSIPHIAILAAVDTPDPYADVLGGFSGSTPIQTVRERRTTEVLVEAYGAAALPWLEAACALWNLDFGPGRALRVAGVAPVGWSPIADRSAFLDSNTEPRWDATLTVLTSETRVLRYPVDTIDSVVVDMNLERAAGVVLPVDVEIP